MVPRSLRIPGWVPALLVVLCFLVRIEGATAPRESTGPQAWETLRGCRLEAEQYFDGDSFHVNHGHRHFIIRLYSVDAPETDREFPDRVREQAQSFDLTEEATLRLGAEARRHVEKRLGSTNFTVITRWEGAPGRSQQQRYYGFVLVGEESLALELVSRGLARVYGKRVAWPDADRSAAFQRQLQSAERRARESRRGAWSGAFRSAAPGKASPLDLNRATQSELEQLPGIGPALAKRIMAGRPYRTVDELERVQGMGPARIGELRGRVKVGTGAGAPEGGAGQAPK
jgi:endonuclease YncB( thermonuclease family)